MDTSVKNINLIELMNSWQGEGPDCGRQMLIARFKHCNMKCPYCDTMIKMNTTVSGSYSIDDLNEALKKSRALMMTGGEPSFNSLKNNNYDQTLKILTECKYQIANVESNGYKLNELINEYKKIQIDNNVKFIYSPKMFNESQLKHEHENTIKLLDHSNVFFKIVINSIDYSVPYVKWLANQTNDKSKVYLMVYGSEKSEIENNFTRIVELADELNFNVTTRLHIVHNFI